jgi:signal transduction histidine kinase
MAAQLETRNGLLRAETESSSQMLSAMTEGVLLADSEGRLVRNNPAAERILGVDLSQAQGTPLVVAARAFPSHSLAETARIAGHPITEVLELPNGQSLAIEVLPLTTDYGPEGDVRSTTEPGDRPPMLFVIRDETARRNTERMRRDFATNVSHELKTPLAGLSLLAETLGRTVKKDPDQAEKFVTQLSNEISRLTELANDLLTLSRLEEPGTVTEAAFVPINVSQLIAEAVDEVRAAADAKGHHLTVSAAPELRVLGDEVALSTMLRNLVENAVRYTEPGGHLEIHAEGRAGEDDRHWVVMEVIDDGVGIPLTDQQRVFERFYRVDKARSRETGGTGLGLSIVRHVAERHGGRVELTSTVGVGSTFTVHLPAI